MNNDNNLSSILNLAKLFAPSKSSSSNAHKDRTLSPLDSSINSESLRVCKSVVPYLSFENQKNLSIVIKAAELISVVNYFNDPNIDSSAPLSNYRSSNNNNNWQEDLLTDVKESLDPKNAFWIDIMFKLKEVQEILNNKDEVILEPIETQAAEPRRNDNDFMEDISPQLTDSQNQILKSLSKVMD